LSDARITQFFGPGPRHPFACVELAFPADSRAFSLTAVTRAFAQAGAPLREELAEGEFPLAEAIGRMARAVLAISDPETCSPGEAGGTAWIALFHPIPREAATVLRQCREAILAVHAPGFSALPEPLRELAAARSTLNATSLTLMLAATGFGLDSLTASHFARVHQTGQGAAGLHFHAMASQDESLTARELSIDKRATIELLNRAGLPTTRAFGVRSIDPLEPLVARTGFPCVVKRRFGAMGLGVYPGLRTLEEVRAAVAEGERGGGAMILENHLPGDDHRILVVGGEVQWVYRRRPAYVVGDGKASVAELVEAENLRRRSAEPAARAFLHDIALDAGRLRFLAERHGMDARSVPAAGARIDLTGPANIALGGTLKDVTPRMHPEVRDLAIRVARLMRADALGIDYISPDIAQPWRGGGGAIIEVNCTPGIGSLRDGCLAIRTKFPRRLSGRVPSFVVLGGKAWRADTARALARALHAQGLAVGETDYDPAASLPAGAHVAPFVAAHAIEALLLDPRVEAMVITADPGDVARCGLPLQRCDALLAQDSGDAAALDTFADRVPAGAPNLAALVADVLAPYRDGTLGGARPHLEWAGGTAREPVLRCWRVRALARAWWRAQVAELAPGSSDPQDTGMIAHADLAAGALALANAELVGAGAPPIPGPFVFAAEDHTFGPPWLEARIALAGERQRAALDRAVERVNAIVG